VQTLASRLLKTNGFPALYAPKCESRAKRSAYGLAGLRYGRDRPKTKEIYFEEE
jgi:hypothetical protein